MIQLTYETKLNKDGVEIDDSMYLVGLDSNNLALQRGTKILNYFGDVRTALRKSLDYSIKGSSTSLSLESMISTIDGIDKAIKELKIVHVGKVEK